MCSYISHAVTSNIPYTCTCTNIHYQIDTPSTKVCFEVARHGKTHEDTDIMNRSHAAQMESQTGTSTMNPEQERQHIISRMAHISYI